VDLRGFLRDLKWSGTWFFTLQMRETEGMQFEAQNAQGQKPGMRFEAVNCTEPLFARVLQMWPTGRACA
jgi:hypothetical protein